MATILDSLVIELGLDPTKLNKGQQQALAQFKQTQQQALATGKAIEGSAQRVTNFLGRMRSQAVLFAAAAFGANGIREFIQQVTTSNAALDRSARMLGTTTEGLSLWRGAAVLAGGTAQGMQSSIAGLVAEFQNFALTGQSSTIPYFRALGVQVSDVSGKMRPFQDVMIDLADAFAKLDPERATAFGRALGFDEGTINLLIKGSAGVKVLLADMEKLNVVNRDAAAASTALEQSWSRLAEGAKGAGNKIITGISPALTYITNALGSFVAGFNTGLDQIKGTKPSDAGTVRGDALRVKPGAGSASLGVSALASSLQSSIPGLDKFTSFNDKFHAGTGSKHAQGLALDFTVKDPSKYAETASAVRRRLAEMGIDATVLDEHNNPSPRSTGSHIHVQFANAAAANKFSSSSGAGGAAAISNAGSAGGNRSSETNIGEINITVPGGDAAEISRNIDQQIKRRGDALNAQSGAQ